MLRTHHECARFVVHLYMVSLPTIKKFSKSCHIVHVSLSSSTELRRRWMETAVSSTPITTAVHSPTWRCSTMRLETHTGELRTVINNIN